MKNKEQLVKRYLEKYKVWAEKLTDTLSFDELNKLYADSFEDAYAEGMSSALVQLQDYFGEDLLILVSERLQELYDQQAEAFNLPYLDGMTVIEKATDYWIKEDLPSLSRLLDSEFHRAYNTGSHNIADLTGNTYNSQIFKTWETALDEKVRETHDYLEGITIPLSERFITFDGDSALYPSGFSLAQNNANCRCILSYKRV